MTTFVALLRGVNVGGRTLAMADLRRVLEGLALGGVRTYLQSGNAVFEAEGSADEHAARIAIGMERDLGMRVGVLVLTDADLQAVVAANPFLDEPGLDQQFLHATLLFREAGEADFGEASTASYSRVWQEEYDKLELPAADGERAVFVGVPPLATPVIYLHLPQGYGRTKLGNSYFERSLGAAATTRNWRTVRALAELSSGSGETA
jgi:uncharacterized protein (DUF1697 family)